jgi:hypothetical protein
VVVQLHFLSLLYSFFIHSIQALATKRAEERKRQREAKLAQLNSRVKKHIPVSSKSGSSSGGRGNDGCGGGGTSNNAAAKAKDAGVSAIFQSKKEKARGKKKKGSSEE